MLLLIILIGFFLRIYNINRFPLRGDEAFTVIHWMREPFAQTLANISTVDPQPPLAYAIYRLWSLIVGSQEWIVRYLPALLNLIGVPVLYVLGKRLADRRIGLAAALLWAIHPFQIWHAQDARNYGIWGALSPLALWLALRALDSVRWRDWMLYVVVALVACYVYYLELFPLAALNVYVFWTYRRNRHVLFRWIASQSVIAVGLAFWFLQGRLLYGSGYGGTAGSFELSLIFAWFIPTLIVGDMLLFQGMILLLLVVIGICLFVWFNVSRKSPILLLLLIILPLLFLAIVSLRLSVFTPRYVLSVSVAFVLMLSILVSTKFRSFRGIRLLLFCSVVMMSVGSLIIYFGVVGNDYTKSPDWRALAEYLRVRTRPNDIIIQTAADEAFTFYFDEYNVLGEHLRLPANPYQSADEIRALLQERLNMSASYWLVALPPPSWVNGAVSREWLNDYTQFIRETDVNGLPARQYMAWDVRPEEIDAAPRAIFSDIVALSGVRLHDPETTNELIVELVWQPLMMSERPLKVFVHLLGDINPTTGTPLWSQDDQFPQDGRQSSADWIVNAPYRDIYTLPMRDLPAGTYTLAVGWYDPATNQRLPLAGTDADYAVIQAVTLP
ncbi:MAG: glycosyltransferase family 39 protein [Chloroflexota bacterium]|nr:glycosyltransferase family 39 protein [Chloroflexota bacterium]